jgi:hypothetical protein
MRTKKLNNYKILLAIIFNCNRLNCPIMGNKDRIAFKVLPFYFISIKSSFASPNQNIENTFLSKSKARARFSNCDTVSKAGTPSRYSALKAYTVVCLYLCPGISTVDGNVG